MKRTLLGFFATLAVAFLPNARVASGQEISFASHAEIMSVLEQQNQRIAELEGHGGGSCCGSSCCDSCDSCCDGGCCDPCCRPGGVIGSVELTFLKPHNSLGNRGAEGTDVEFGYELAPRITAGYQGSDGLGWRVRYWEFNHTATAAIAGTNRTDSQNYDTYVLDLEFVDSMSLGCYWDASFFAGFRYMEFDEERVSRVTATGVVDTAHSFDTAGYGLTVGGELRRCVGNNLAGFVNVRGSVIMGDESEYTDPGLNTLVDQELDNIYYIWEAQAGVQWTQELEMGGYLFARAAGEVQFWDNVVGEPFFDGGESVGFGGMSLSVGVIR